MPYRTFTLAEAAAYLHLTARDLELLVRQDVVPFERTGSRLVFRKKELDAWASQRVLAFAPKPLAAFHRTTSRGPSGGLLEGLLHPQAVEPRLCSKTKPSVLRDMAALADRTGLVCSPGEFLASLEAREALCSTALPDGIALLHPRHHEPYMFVESFIGLGRAANPVPFGAPDGRKTDLFFLICCQDDRLHLHVLARLCMLSKQAGFLAALRAADSAAALIGALAGAERKVVRSL